jgi:ferritin
MDMMLSEMLNDALNVQVVVELGNMAKYMQVQSFMEDLQLKHLADFFKKQADGEHDHANLFMNYINDRNGGKVILGDIDAPKSDFGSVEDVADFYVNTERQTTQSIEALYDLALSEKSYIDLDFLQTMLREQIEEEDLSMRVSENLKKTKDIVLLDATFEG